MIHASVSGARVRVRCPITKPPTHSLNCYWEQLMETCSVGGCAKPKKYANGLCGMHWTRNYRTGDKQSTKREFGSGSISGEGYLVHTITGKRVGSHVSVAEKALGKRLPKGAVVHHLDEDRLNNAPSNLVICQSTSYHALLHQRAAAFDDCGNASWRKCWVCQKYDDPKNLYINGQVGHKACIKKHNANYYQIKKGAKA